MGLYAREYIEGRLNDASDLEWQDPSERFDPLNNHRVVFLCRDDCGLFVLRTRSARLDAGFLLCETEIITNGVS